VFITVLFAMSCTAHGSLPIFFFFSFSWSMDTCNTCRPEETQALCEAVSFCGGSSLLLTLGGTLGRRLNHLAAAHVFLQRRRHLY